VPLRVTGGRVGRVPLRTPMLMGHQARVSGPLLSEPK
jgi:hypothetical protein